MERGKARYTYISTGSNTTVKSTPGTLYRVVGSHAAGGTVLVDDSAGGIGANPNFNSAAPTSTLIGSFGTLATATVVDLGPGIGFNTGLTVAASSNAHVTVVYE